MKSVFICLLLVMASAYGQTKPAPSVPRGMDLGAASDGMVGVVVNETVTANGYEFYRIFTLLWSDKPDSRNYALHIQERLSKRYGNRVGIYWGQKQVYSAALPLKYDGLHELCAKAVEEIQANIITLSMQAPDTADIVREEM